ncbi:unnamed protein product [Danaus chrysippus]|uniref:(African queen) hypothetical protein n=1 Tax=Danaus chrysippus TaxID=151541 RepID=A0A8J2R977_9NEOP|nr:unnamed protein product [Danaus chrysippus]
MSPLGIQSLEVTPQSITDSFKGNYMRNLAVSVMSTYIVHFEQSDAGRGESVAGSGHRELTVDRCTDERNGAAEHRWYHPPPTTHQSPGPDRSNVTSGNTRRSADVCSLTEERARPPGDITHELVGVLGIASQTLKQPKYYTYDVSI